MLPSAAGVIDPLLSTGFPLTLLGILRLLDLLERTKPGDDDREAALAAYERTTLAELDATEQLVGALYATMDDPPLFTKVELFPDISVGDAPLTGAAAQGAAATQAPAAGQAPAAAKGAKK